MVSHADGRISLTAAEAEVMMLLAKGPADLGLRTEEFTAGGGTVRLVARRPVKALQKAGLVAVDAGAQVSLTDAGRRAIDT